MKTSATSTPHHARSANEHPVRTAWTATLAWLLLAVAAIANGTLREAVLTPKLGEPLAAILSIAILVALILGVSYAFVRAKWRSSPYATLFLIGGAWAVGSAVFEIGLGRLVLGMPWGELLAAYNVLAGELWILAPVAMLVGPALARLALARRWS